jgi:hypothetical protein
MVKRRREKMAPSIWIYPEIVAVCLGSQSVVAAKSVQALAIYTIYIYTYTLTHTHTFIFRGNELLFSFCLVLNIFLKNGVIMYVNFCNWDSHILFRLICSYTIAGLAWWDGMGTFILESQAVKLSPMWKLYSCTTY